MNKEDTENFRMTDLIDEAGDLPKMIEPKRTVYQTWGSLLAGSSAAAASKTCTAPLSRLTILMQIQSTGSTSITQRSGLLGSIKSVVAKEGVASLWKGNLVSVLHKFPYGGINYYTYERSKVYLEPYWLSAQDPGMGVRFVCGFLGGSTASALTYPLDMIRTRLAASPAIHPKLLPTLADVVKKEGLSALYQGVGTTLVCQGLNIAINFAVYETLQVKLIALEKQILKEYLNREPSEKQRGSALSSLLCGACSGSIASVIIFPLDLVRRRQQVTVGSKLSAFEVARSILKSEGWRGLNRGIVPELVKVVPAVGINFYAYELVRQELLGVKIAPR